MKKFMMKMDSFISVSQEDNAILALMVFQEYLAYLYLSQNDKRKYGSIKHPVFLRKL